MHLSNRCLDKLRQYNIQNEYQFTSPVNLNINNYDLSWS